MGPEVTYEIEGGLDFFKELKNIKTRRTDDVSGSATRVSIQIEDKPIEKCLITDEKLGKDHITLKCGHKFNYVPLFKEVVFQKCSMLPKNVSSKIVTSYIQNTPASASAASAASASAASASASLPTMNSTTHSSVATVTYNSSYNLETTKVNYNEMKCPYCRSITPHILPYYPYPDVSKIKYVNSPADLALPVLMCEYHKHISSKRQDNESTSTSTSTCRSGCIYHEKYDLMLCNKHFNKLEMSAELNETATTISTTRRKAKSVSNTHNENVIISHHNPATSVCSFQLLSGPRKGCPCGKAIWIPKIGVSYSSLNLTFCRVHYERQKIL